MAKALAESLTYFPEVWVLMRGLQDRNWSPNDIQIALQSAAEAMDLRQEAIDWRQAMERGEIVKGKGKGKGEAIHSEDEEMIEITVTRNGNVVYQGIDPDAMEAILQPGDVLNRADGQRIIFQGAAHVETKGKGKGKGFSAFSGKGRRLSE